jgi:hypothetical protein
MMKKRTKKRSEMDTAALRKATKRYDAEFVADDESRPLTAAEREVHRKARKVGRPKLGKGSQVVSLSVEKELLARADAYAKRQGLGRSEMFILGLKELLVANGP